MDVPSVAASAAASVAAASGCAGCGCCRGVGFRSPLRYACSVSRRVTWQSHSTCSYSMLDSETVLHAVLTAMCIPQSTPQDHWLRRQSTLQAGQQASAPGRRRCRGATARCGGSASPAPLGSAPPAAPAAPGCQADRWPCCPAERSPGMEPVMSVARVHDHTASLAAMPSNHSSRTFQAVVEREV